MFAGFEYVGEPRIVDLSEDMIPLDIMLVAASERLLILQFFGEIDAGRAAGHYPEYDTLIVPSGLLHTLTQNEAPIARLHEVGRQLRNELQAPVVTLSPDFHILFAMDTENIVEYGLWLSAYCSYSC